MESLNCSYQFSQFLHGIRLLDHGLHPPVTITSNFYFFGTFDSLMYLIDIYGLNTLMVNVPEKSNLLIIMLEGVGLNHDWDTTTFAIATVISSHFYHSGTGDLEFYWRIQMPSALTQNRSEAWWEELSFMATTNRTIHQRAQSHWIRSLHLNSTSICQWWASQFW